MMLDGRQRDLVGGALLAAFGAFVAWYAQEHYALGTLRRMGPGMFPFGAGLALAGMGVLVMLPALLRPRGLPEDGPAGFRVLPAAIILAGMLAFALLVRPLGFIPAILGLVVIVTFAGTDRNPLRIALLAVVLCLIAWGVFRLGLNLPLTMFRWSW